MYVAVTGPPDTMAVMTIQETSSTKKVPSFILTLANAVKLAAVANAATIASAAIVPAKTIVPVCGISVARPAHQL